MEQHTERKIIHCDLDCFYAAVEMLDNPNLRGKPVAVGGSPAQRGVIATCNYEARHFGIHSAMPSSRALRLCPDLILIPGNFARYREVSSRIFALYREYTDLIEPISLDEAYLDVSASNLHQGSATRIAQEIRARVRAQESLVVSAGVSCNKMLAKIASDWNKPDGLFVIAPADVASFVQDLPIKLLPGVGPVTASRLTKLGIETAGTLQACSRQMLQRHFGSFGEVLYDYSHGIDKRPVQASRKRLSLSVEHTYERDVPDLASCLAHLPALLEELQQRLQKRPHPAIHKVFVKVKFANFQRTTVERVAHELEPALLEKLLSQAFQRGNKPVRLLGVGVRFGSGESTLAQQPSYPQLPGID